MRDGRDAAAHIVISIYCIAYSTSKISWFTNVENYHYYAVRRLNPFQGVIQIIKSDTARALSLDGINWEIQQGFEVDGFSELCGRRLDKVCFPELLLHQESCDHDLVSAYLIWISPYLLTLQRLSDKSRKILEHQAQHRALLVDRNWRLYPKVIDPNFINTARIEAQFHQINQHSKSTR